MHSRSVRGLRSNRGSNKPLATILPTTTRAAMLLWLAGCAGPSTVSPPVAPVDDTAATVSPRLGHDANQMPTPQGMSTLDNVPSVPLEGVIPSSNPGSRGFYYPARAGDTLDSVAQQYGTNATELRRANGLDRGANPRPGQLLFIPSRPGAGGT